jgi:flagellar basal-body rod protein FlgC
MSDFIKAMHAASSGMQAQSSRLRLSTENIANSDTPGYRRKTVSFEEALGAFGDDRSVKTGPINMSEAEFQRIHDPSHPLAGEDGYYESSNVNLVVEIADAREAGRSYEANLRMFDQARQMASSILDLLRR